MKLPLLTALVAPAAFVAAAENEDGIMGVLRGSIPKLQGAQQLVDVGAHCEGCQPDYCYVEPQQYDYWCYKAGIPKCCNKTKGNCPNNKIPGCECKDANGQEIDCDPNGERDDRCILGNNDCLNGEFCAVGTGQCMLRIAEIFGRCEQRPGVCQSSYFPVCGCDNRDYPNDCAAHAAGVNVAYEGECNSGSQSCEYYGIDNDTCSGNSFCHIGAGDCRQRSAFQEGFCMSPPQMCTYESDPQCGCDGNTYANECDALSQGVNIQHSGECNNAQSCEYYGVDNDTCSGNEFCHIGAGDCRQRSAFQEGFCMPSPQMCTYESDPQCGCDGNTYANECDALSQGVNIQHSGEC